MILAQAFLRHRGASTEANDETETWTRVGFSDAWLALASNFLARNEQEKDVRIGCVPQGAGRVEHWCSLVINVAGADYRCAVNGINEA